MSRGYTPLKHFKQYKDSPHFYHAELNNRGYPWSGSVSFRPNSHGQFKLSIMHGDFSGDDITLYHSQLVAIKSIIDEALEIYDENNE